MWTSHLQGSLDAKNRRRVACGVVEIVDIVSLKFASDEAAGEKLTSWNHYFVLAMPHLFIESSLHKVKLTK